MINESEKVVVVIEVETTSESLLTAAQAREIANRKQMEEVERMLPKVLDCIRESAEKGLGCAWYSISVFQFGSTAERISSRLQALGYTCGLTPSYLKISW